MSFQFATATKILFAAGALDQLSEHVTAFGTRALLVLGNSQRERHRVEAALNAAGNGSLVVSVAGEPRVDDVVKLLAHARTEQCNWVLAVGGGSVIDAGKALSALLANSGDPFDYLEVVGKGRPLEQPALPFVAVPTTSGTGAEVTKNAVLTSEEHRVKVSLRSDSMLPKLALIDPSLTLTLPALLTASTSLDALTQCLEPFVSCHANPLTDALSRKGLELASHAVRAAYHHGADLRARSDMALVSLLGGLSLANAKLGAVHGFAGPLGGLYPAPHGSVCARLLAGVMRVNAKALQARQPTSPALPRYAEAARLLTGNPRASIADGVQWLEDLVEELDIPRLSAFGVSSQSSATILAKARASSSMKGNPIVLHDEELREILESSI